MDDLDYGTRDKRGNWRPNEPLSVGPLLDTPWSAKRVLAWLPSYFLPWNALFFAIALGVWVFLLPEKAVMKTLHWEWVAGIYVRNALLVILLFGGIEFVLYMRRLQGGSFKYNPKFPQDTRSNVFWFQSQHWDGVLRTFLSGIPIWTGYEVLLLWAWANDLGPWRGLSENWIWLAIFGLVLPLVHELHFFAIHRLIHLPKLYKWVHSVHHNSINPSPWSSLSMHPIEHLLYWSGALVHLLIMSHPVLALYHLQTAGLGAVIGHIGFHRIHTNQNESIDTHAYAHYLHHKYFEVNYADGTLPLDKWFGTWHDGTSEGDQQMKARFQAKKQRNSLT